MKILFIFLFFSIYIVCMGQATTKGDLDGNIRVDLADALLGLQVLSGQAVEVNDSIRMEDVIYILNFIASGEIFTNFINMTFRLIHADTFFMGSPQTESGRENDENLHAVSLTENYYMQVTEVTNQQFVEFLNHVNTRGTPQEPWFDTKNENQDSHIIGETGHFKVEEGYKNHAVAVVSWFGAKAMCNWLSDYYNDIYRLPTEAEWEYAARGKNQSAFSNGEIAEFYCNPVDPQLNLIAWFCGNSLTQIHPVAQKQPNDFGLFDMHGNVWEWCLDWYQSDAYITGPDPDINPQGPDDGQEHVIRGGSYFREAFECRAAYRNMDTSDMRDHETGFRLVREVLH